MKTKNQLSKLLGQPFYHFEKFHQKTKIKDFTTLKKESFLTSMPKISSKAYARMKEINLSKPELPKIYFQEIFSKRKSSCKFSNNKLSIKILSSLLFYSAGIKQEKKVVSRFYPSTALQYPSEVYLLSLNTQLPNALYHYYPRNHSLEKLSSDNNFKLEKIFRDHEIKRAACMILISAVFERTTKLYGDRGYRYILIETGHLAQNVYLVSVAFNLCCQTVETFIDDELNDLLDIDGIKESIIHVLAIGEK